VADDRTYIRLHDGMPGHPKVRGLSDRAFRTYVRALCYCSEYLTDGTVVKVVARDLGTPKVWGELVDANLVESAPNGYLMHDYLEHQRSAEEVRLLKAHRGDTGTLGNHVRWHVVRRQRKEGCEHCYPADGSDPIANGSQVRSQTDRKPIASTEAETEAETEVKNKNSSRGVSHVSRATASTPPRFPDHCQQHANVAEPGPCGGCADARKAAKTETEKLPDYRLRIVPPLCGKCDDRWINTQSGLKHCPRCHPAEASSQQGECDYHPGNPNTGCAECDQARELYIRQHRGAS
jgi:hypothetical protein